MGSTSPRLRRIQGVIYLSQICSVCKIDLAMDKFYPDRDRIKGRRSTCIKCEKIRTQERWRRNKIRNQMKDPYADPSLKRCPSCNKKQERVHFWRDKVTTDGLRQLCIKCDTLLHKKSVLLRKMKKHG